MENSFGSITKGIFEYCPDPCGRCNQLIPMGWATTHKKIKGYICSKCERWLKQERKREIIHEKIKKYGLTERHKFINGGTVLIDNKFYYYVQKHKVRVKGSTKYYNCNFDKFVKVFLKK